MTQRSTGAGAIVEAVRLLVTLATTAAGLLIGRQVVEWRNGDPDVTVVVGAVIGAGLGYVLGGVIGRVIRRALVEAPRLVARSTGPELFAGAFGLMVGLTVGVVVAVPLIVFLPPFLGWSLASLLILVIAAFATITFAARSRDLLVTMGLREREPLRPIPEPPVAEPQFLVDSSAAIDGRILDLGRSRLVSGGVLVPEFVIDELQAISDSGDRSRRRRGRRGLDVLDALRDVAGINFSVPEDTVPEHSEVDAKLVALAARVGATLVTTDHNLAKAAELRDIRVLNPHALGESLRPMFVKGDRLELRVEREGSEPGQGVGFLEDGTMVVIEGAAAAAGSTVEIEVSNNLRTAVGRMMFAKLAT